MKTVKNIFFKMLLFLTFFIFNTNCSQSQSANILNGHFLGKGKIIVIWCEQDSLAFDITIDKSNTVSGMIGDAKIINGKVRKNTWGSTDFIIVAELDGYLVEKEKIKRKSIKIPFDIIGDKLIGGFGTSGHKIGNKETMVLSGSNMVLKKQ